MLSRIDKSYEEICELMTEFPKTRVLIDHFGFAKGANDPNWRKVLSLAKFPQVSVKISAQFRVATSSEKIDWRAIDVRASERFGQTFWCGTISLGERFPVRRERVRLREGFTNSKRD